MAMKRPVGKPRYEPSISDKATVQNLAALGKSQEVIASCLGTRGISVPTLRKNFAHELKNSQLEVSAMAMASMVKGLRNGDAWATTFYLSRREGWSEKSALDNIAQLTIKRVIGVADSEI